MWIFHDNVIENENDDENFEKNFFFFNNLSFWNRFVRNYNLTIDKISHFCEIRCVFDVVKMFVNCVIKMIKYNKQIYYYAKQY